MLRIRLSRTGRRNHSKFRVTLAEGKRTPSGKFIEILGYYDPHTKEKVFKEERIQYWISKGAQPSNTVHNLLVDAKVIKGEKVTSWRPKKKELTEEEKKAAEEKQKEEAAKKEEKKAEEVKEEAPKKEEKAEEPKAEEKKA